MLCEMKVSLVCQHIYHNLIHEEWEQTGDIITFTQFEEGNILTNTRNDAESGDKSVDESIMTIYSGDELDHDLISTEMLEDICDGSQTHPNINIR